MKRYSLLLMALFSANAFAGSTAGNLSTLHFFSNGITFAYTSGVRSAAPACAVNQQSRFALDGTTPGGKVQLAGLLSAYTQGKQIAIVGTGTCSVYTDTETISYFYTVDN